MSDDFKEDEEGRLVSESGAPVYKYDDVEPREGFTPPDMSDSNIDEISDHIEKHIGPIENVFHEIISDLVHIDVHIVEPTTERPFYTLVTSGMSDKPMNAPEGAEEFRYAEIMICLPADWPMGEDEFKREENYWPIRNLKFLARFPHEYESWVFFGHTIPNGQPAEEYAPGAGFTGVMLSPPLSGGEDFISLEISEEKTIHFLAMIPLYDEEMDLKLKAGAEALEDKFDEEGIFELLMVGRKNVAKRKKFLGLF